MYPSDAEFTNINASQVGEDVEYVEYISVERQDPPPPMCILIWH